MVYSSELIWQNGSWFVEIYLGDALILRMPMDAFAGLDVVKSIVEKALRRPHLAVA
jgi:hypothetical protein